MDIITECFSFLSIHRHCCDKLFKIFNNSSRITSKFVASHFVFCKLQRDLAFSVRSIISVGAGLMQVTMQYAYPAWPAKTKQRMVKEIAMATGIFVKRRRKTLLYSCKWQEYTQLEKKLVDYSPKQDDHKQWTFKHRNKPNRSKSTNHKPWPLELIQVNMCFLRGPLRWLTEQKHPNFLRSLQNAVQSNTTNLAVIIICKKHSVVRGWK